MHCSACVNKIEKALTDLDGVLSAKVDLSSKSATITGNAQLETLIESVKDVGYEPYLIEEKIENPKSHKKDSPSQIKQLFPLFLIFFYITVFSLLMNRSNFHVNAFMYDFMGLFYIVFSFFKFLDYKNFPASFSMYDPIAKILPL